MHNAQARANFSALAAYLFQQVRTHRERDETPHTFAYNGTKGDGGTDPRIIYLQLVDDVNASVPKFGLVCDQFDFI